MPQEVNITEEQFRAFEGVRKSGEFNMIDPAVREVCNISKSEHYFIMDNYSELYEKYFGGKNV